MKECGFTLWEEAREVLGFEEVEKGILNIIISGFLQHRVEKLKCPTTQIGIGK